MCVGQLDRGGLGGGSEGSGWSPWQGLGNGAASYWYTLPVSEPYSLHVGCGGTTSSGPSPTRTPKVSGTDNSFICQDISDRELGTCQPE